MQRGDVLDRQTYRAGKVIFREGDVGGCAYVVQRGAVEIYKSVGDREIILGKLGAGELFGEMALIDGSRRMASARCAEAAVVVIIPGTEFDIQMKRASHFLKVVLRLMLSTNRRASARLAAAEAKLRELGYEMPEVPIVTADAQLRAMGYEIDGPDEEDKAAAPKPD